MLTQTVTPSLLLEYCKELRESLGSSRRHDSQWYFDTADLVESAAQELQETARDLQEAGVNLIQSPLPMQ